MLKKYLEEMLSELENNKYICGLIPAPRPSHHHHFIRVKLQSNPTWYSKLCSTFIKNRSNRRKNAGTHIHREWVFKAFRQYFRKGKSRSKIWKFIVAEAKQRRIRATEQKIIRKQILCLRRAENPF